MKVLIVDDETLLRRTLQAHIESSGAHIVYSASDVDDAIEVLESEIIDLAFVDLTLDDGPTRAGLDLLYELRKISPNTVAVAMTGYNEDALVEQCLKAGAADYILKPLDADMIKQTLRKAPVLHRLLRKNQNYKNQAGKDVLKPIELTSKSKAFKDVIEMAKKLRNTGQSVLIRGENGTGKEVLARYLWSLEGDDSRPFIAVNCGAIPSSLAESELFGHRKGSFSGAIDHRQGKFESAHGGDLFLDELATLSMEVQVKLLRALANGEISPVGQDNAKKVSCRVITATNENLEDMIKDKTFREDLFFRVKQFCLTIPPLRERKEDILDLTSMFLRESQFPDKTLSSDAEKLLLNYSWPGNVRELKSAIEVAAILSDSSEIQESDITPHLQTEVKLLDKAISSNHEINEDAIKGNFNHLIREFERKLIETAINKCGSDTAAAKFLGIPRSTLGDIKKRLRLTKKEN
ncbi:MAG: sigma-54-dependent Fis family transcriptional regulator [Deltaproteobacteria bacterium]|nr:MAG: sigma-54-dependent Fis family transcriptional regulator [Deltaproteobacteria bacterium]TNF31619.1 MAG: sigma-54-dependent Fis family transcriptional regulator [Deltaproteobacteria bacterium]